MASMLRKLGKLAPKHNKKALKGSRYFAADLPPATAKVYYEYRVKSWPMFLNNQLGCCVVSSGGHIEQNWTTHTGPEIVITDAVIESAYETVGGYVPGDESTDNGIAITDFLAWWQITGFAGKKIDGWIQIDHTNLEHVKQAIRAFGVLDIGVELPNSAMDQNDAGQTWDVVANDGGIDGGHCIPIFGYGSEGTTCVTWGALQPMTWDWFSKYVDEAYALVSLDWIGKGGTSPSNLDIAQLREDLQALKG